MENIYYTFAAVIPFVITYFARKRIKITPKDTAIILGLVLVASIGYWVRIGDLLLTGYQAVPFISCFIWVWADEVLRKREVFIQYNVIFKYKEGKVYVTFPDFANVSFVADTRVGAVKQAEEVLKDTLHGKKQPDLPDKTPRERIKIWEDTEIVEVEVVMEVVKGMLEKKE